MALIDRYLDLAVQQRASDIHFSSGEPVRLRVDGDLVALEEPAKSTEELEELLLEICSETEQEKWNKGKNLDKSYMSERSGNFRVNIFGTRKGISAVLRSIPTKIPTIEDLGLPPVIVNLCELPKGLVLVTGPTGSGKSTTLAAMLNYINQRYPYHILTAEDPVEFVHESQQSLVNQREIGNSCPTFSDALKYALREDPDVILVGEMRDLETIALALTAAETGHLVFGTLHTRGAAASVDRIIDSFPANQQSMIRAMISESLAAVISQALMKRADGRGRIAAYEIMVVNHAISNLIREGKTFQITSSIQTARKEGMILMDQHIKELVAKGLVTQQEAASYLDEGGAVVIPKGPSAPIGQAPRTLAGPPAGARPMSTGMKPPGIRPAAGGSPASRAVPSFKKPAPVATPVQEEEPEFQIEPAVDDLEVAVAREPAPPAPAPAAPKPRGMPVPPPLKKKVG